MERAPEYHVMGPVATVVDAAERREVDRVGAGIYRTLHRDCIKEVLDDMKHRRVSAVLLSGLHCKADDLPRVVREFPRIPALILINRSGEPSPAELLALGECGVRRVIDVRTPAGWTRLRDTLAADVGRERDQQAMAELVADLADSPADLLKFADALFREYSGPRTVRALARSLGVIPSTLVSRFYRAGLPAPKIFLTFAGLVRAARLFENPGLSIADVANHLDHSSSQSFGRHVRTYLGISAGEFRRTYDGVRMMLRFREQLVHPYRDRLRTMTPLTMRPRTLRQPRAEHPALVH